MDAKSPARSNALTVLVALTVLFGLQLFRMWLPLLAFLVRDRFGWNSDQIATLAFVVLASGCLAPWLAGRLGLRRLAWLAVGGLALVRLEVQLWQGDPGVDVLAACLGVAAFAFAAPILLLLARAASDPGALAAGWLGGLVLDLALHGLYGTWDMVWRSDLGSLLLVLALVVASWLALRRVVTDLDEPDGPDGAGAVAWLGAWVLLFLYVLCFGNPGRFAELAELTMRTSWLLLAGLLAASVLGHCFGWWTRWPAMTASVSVVVLGVVAWQPWARGVPALLGAGLGTVAMAASTALLLTRAASSPATGSLARLTAAHGGALVLYFGLIFVSSSGWDMRLPVAADRMPVLAVLVIGLCAAACVRGPQAAEPARGARSWPALLFALLVIAGCSLGLAWTRALVEPPQTARWPLRVVTYNVHCGIDPSGRFDLEALARTIEAEKPDVVLLQETSRGWMVNGNADVAGWLARRLGMNLVFHGTADPTWGNAVLTRLPVHAVERWSLPPDTLLLRRGVLEVDLGLADGDHLRVLDTHLHHPRAGGGERIAQSRRLVEIWDDTLRTLIAGDLNALPDEPEIVYLRDAGLVDALDQAGSGPGFTYPSWQPVRRIDYVWLSPDLAARDASVSASTASDHAAVTAVVAPMP